LCLTWKKSNILQLFIFLLMGSAPNAGSLSTWKTTTSAAVPLPRGTPWPISRHHWKIRSHSDRACSRPGYRSHRCGNQTAALQDEQLTLLGEIVTMIHQTTTRDAHRNHIVHRTLAQWMNEFHDADQQQLQQMTNTLRVIITEQQRMNEQLQARQQTSRPVRIYRTHIRRRTLTTRHDLTRASVWTADVLSRTWRNRLLGASAGATLTLVAQLLILVSAATPTVILRA